jgi:hypothetical protein
MTDASGWPDEAVPNPATSWNSHRFRRTWRCSWCRRPSTRAFKRPQDPKGWFTPACEDCWRQQYRRPLPATELTRSNRRLRWVVRCACGHTARHLYISQRVLRGSCRECWQKHRTCVAWLRAFQHRSGLIRRNVADRDLRARLLRWNEQREQDRADRTWRKLQTPSGPNWAS